MTTLDPKVLAEIRALNGPDDDVLAEVLRLFLADVPQQLSTLRAALGARDGEAIRQVAHRLKGTASGIGARQMAAVCGAVEAAARQGALDRAAQSAATLDDEIAGVRDALEREVRG